ncbi:MAG: squalene synthase HpnC [Alphaproteobacteria bacterium]|nr:MAG: squalene synthase HpnC [Alphaproteobacteria bacterium]
MIEAIETPSGKGNGDENFPVAHLIRRDLRGPVGAYYHFARNADDIADNPHLIAQDKIDRLNIMDAVLDGKADDALSPSAAALRASLDQTGVNPAHAHELLIAFRRDATKSRYADWAELMDYCRYSAAPVGRYMLELHGIPAASSWPPSDALCAALQIINHVQDCGKDYQQMDRVYLPLDILADTGADISMLKGTSCTPPLRRALNLLLDKMDPLMAAACALPPAVDDRRMKINTSVIVSLAEAMVTQLRRGDPLAGTGKPNKARKIAAIIRGFARVCLP